MRKQLNVRIPGTTTQQIAALCASGYESQAHVIIMAVDRLYRQHQQETRTMTTVNLTNSANIVLGEPGPTDLDSIREVVAGWNAETIAYAEAEGQEVDPDDLPRIEVVGDEVRYYNSDKPGDYEVVGTVI